ncbi:Protein disulfide isomerase-like 5-1 [Diplonema papillatum]|nr:Protein disulfide isomerase-like 5-1 [Diplonema papillatum]
MAAMAAARSIVLVLLLSVFSPVLCDDAVPESSAVAFTEENFSQTQEGTWMLMFWAPWCAHCRRVKPQFHEAGNHLKEKAPGLGTVDCTAEESKPVCDSLGVSSYPTFKYMVDGSEVMQYDGPRSPDDFVRFMSRLADSSIHVLAFTEADLSELQKRDDVNVFVFCVPPGTGATPQITWIARRGLTFGRSHFGIHPSNTKLCGGRSTAFLLNDMGWTEVTPEKGSAEESLEDDIDSARMRSVLSWVAKRKHLMVDRIDQSTFHHVAKSDKPYLCMFVTKDETWETVRPFLNVLRKVTDKPLAEEFAFGWLDGVSYADWISELVPLDRLPTILIYHMADESSFASEEATIAVHHAVAAGEDSDGAMQAAVEDMLAGVLSGRYQLIFNGPSGYILGAAQRVAPFLLPHLRELRRAAQSDVLFIGMVLVICALLMILIVNFIQLIVFGPSELDPMDPDGRGGSAHRPQAQMTQQQLQRLQQLQLQQQQQLQLQQQQQQHVPPSDKKND